MQVELVAGRETALRTLVNRMWRIPAIVSQGDPLELKYRVTDHGSGFGPIDLFLNDRKGGFKEVGMQSGLAYDVNGNARGAMGIDATHYRNDAQLAHQIGR